MAIYEITDKELALVPTTTLAAHGIRERQDLQRLLRANIGAIAPDVYVLAEEYGDWEDSKRRIDLLCIDSAANLVVVELKRTEDGGHMELQAIRYAAMVHMITFPQAVEAHAKYLGKNGSSEDAQAAILKFLDWDEPREKEFAQDIRIVLVSSEFSKEITTSVLWLNERDLDIRCVRLRPYSLGSRILLDIQQVLPLPEAASYQVQLRKKAAEERQSQSAASDWTRFDLSVDGQVFTDLVKRRLFYFVIRSLIDRGIKPADLYEFFPENRWLKVAGRCTPQEFREKAGQLRNPRGTPYNLRRFFVGDDDLFFVDGDTYAFTDQISRYDLPTLERLKAAYPDLKISYSAANQGTNGADSDV